MLLNKFKSHLDTTDNQFGFKKKHSTEMCCFALKEIIDMYTSNSTPVYLCFMDASKAFDKVNHFHLYKKLLSRGVPTIVMRLLRYWYGAQKFAVRWNGILSQGFTVTNGIRQGGVLSPYLYNAFVDELSERLTKLGVGCLIDGKIINHLFYADDSVLVAPSPTALQYLIDACSRYAEEYEITYNCTKTKCMYILPDSLADLRIPDLYLKKSKLVWTTSKMYLGVVFSSDQLDDLDINRERCSMYGRGNILVRKFKKCSESIKLRLFKSYCNQFYCSALWCRYSNLNKLRVAYNNTFRMLFNIRGIVSYTNIYMNVGLYTWMALLRKAMYNLYSRVSATDNCVLHTVFNSCFFKHRSHLYKHWKDEFLSTYVS